MQFILTNHSCELAKYFLRYIQYCGKKFYLPTTEKLFLSCLYIQATLQHDESYETSMHPWCTELCVWMHRKLNYHIVCNTVNLNKSHLDCFPSSHSGCPKQMCGNMPGTLCLHISTNLLNITKLPLNHVQLEHTKLHILKIQYDFKKKGN